MRAMGFIDPDWADLPRLVFNVIDGQGYRWQYGRWVPGRASEVNDGTGRSAGRRRSRRLRIPGRLVARGAAGRLSLRWWSPAKETYEERALGHGDRELGETEAKQVSAALLSATQLGRRQALAGPARRA